MIVGILRVLLFLTLVLQCRPADVTETDVLRRIGAGYLHGRKVETKHGAAGLVFLGIPYAEAPIGDLRYKAPVAKKAWEGVLDVRQYRVSCLYNSSLLKDQQQLNKFMSEDCLHLNVFTSTVCMNRSGCPVLFYLHGGGFNYGTPITVPEDAILDTWARRDVIFVSTNFRLGSFGFFNSGNKSSAATNVGIRDQLEALRWVQTEIQHFGGDGKRITVIGMASGAVNADLLSITGKANGLFQQAILLSGAARSVPLRRDTNYRASRELAIRAGCSTAANYTNTNIDTVMDCLRKVDAGFLLRYQREMEDSKFMDGFHGAILDDWDSDPVFNAEFWRMNRNRRSQPMIIGTAVRDLEFMHRLLMNSDGNKPSKNKAAIRIACAMAIRYWGLNVTKARTNACVKEYGKGRTDELLADIVVYLPAYQCAFANSVQGGQTFLFDIVEPLKLIQLPPVSSPITEHDVYANIVAHFVYTGKPNNDSNYWSPFNRDDGNYLQVKGDFAHTGMAVEYHSEALYFWHTTIQSLNDTDVDVIIRNPTTRPPTTRPKSTMKPMPTNHSHPDVEKFDLAEEVKHLIAEAKELNAHYENDTQAVKREYMAGLADLADRLKQALAKWRQKVIQDAEASFNRSLSDYLHRMTTRKPMIKPSPLPRPTHHPHFVPWWKRGHGSNEKNVDLPWVRIEGEETDEGDLRIDVDVPPSGIDRIDEIEDLVDRIINELNNHNNSRIEKAPVAMHGDDLTPMVQYHMVRSLLPVIVPPGNLTEPTVPTLTIEKSSAWGSWSWILLVLCVALAICLVITCILFIQNRNKRLHYERIA